MPPGITEEIIARQPPEAQAIIRALLADNAQLRKAVNSLLRATLGHHVGAGPPPAAGRQRPWWQPGNGGRGPD